MPKPDDTAARRFRLGYPFALLVLALSLALVLIAWSHSREREEKLASEQFRARAGQVASLVQLRFNSLEATLRGGASLFAVIEHPTPQQWHGYVDALRLQAKFPALLGLGYAALLDQHGLMRVQEEWRAAGRGLLQIRPYGLRSNYGPVLYLEPNSAENRQAIGYDMYAQPTRRAAMQAAMESGQPRLTGEVFLAQDAPREVPALVLYMPVYAQDAAPDTAAARRAAMRGWVYAPMRIGAMLEAAIGPVRGGMRVRVVDVTGNRQRVLHEDRGIDGPHAFTHSLALDFNGRRWRFDFFSGPLSAAAPQLVAVDRLLLAGVVASLLLFALAWMLASTQARAQRIAERMTESYRRSEQRFRNAMRYSAIGKALLDSNGGIVDVNPSFERIVGRDRESLLGHSFNALLLESESRPVSTSQMEAFSADGGVIRLTRSLSRDDGGVRHVHLTFAPVPNEPGEDISRLVQVEDVTERLRAEAAVRALNRTLEARVAARTRELSEANRELESFAYSVSHDLRAPLRGIEGFSRLLEERHGDGLDATGREYLGRVRKATARMGELIDALLKLSRIGRSGLSLEDVDVSALAADVAAALAEDEPGREVALRIQPGMRARADHALLHTLLENLLGNAWKFTRDAADARIEVGLSMDHEGRAWFHVRDNGAGFAPEYADKLFRPFQRLHAQDEFPGHGIGLASVKRIVERHGGEIRAEGRPGGGAVFRFTLSAASGVED